MPERDRRLRFGGVQTAERYLFELTGGRLCLDLANTLDERKTDHPRELLRNYQDLIDWGTQAGAVTDAEAALLRAHADRHPRAARTALDQARALREAIFQVFGAAAAARPVLPTALALVDRAIGRAAAMRGLTGRRATGFSWEWRGDGTDLERVLWPVAWSAAELLTSPDLDRVRLCAGTTCAWLFIDTSKNRTRRWCDMSVCGNRAKARRHYAKVAGDKEPARRNAARATRRRGPKAGRRRSGATSEAS